MALLNYYDKIYYRKKLCNFCTRVLSNFNLKLED